MRFGGRRADHAQKHDPGDEISFGGDLIQDQLIRKGPDDQDGFAPGPLPCLKAP